jgi:hypothetical protein
MLKSKSLESYFFFFNEIINKIFPLFIVVLPYIFNSKKIAGEISYVLALYVPIGVYLVGNIKQESIKLYLSNISFLSEKLSFALVSSFGLSLILIFISVPYFEVVIWRTSDLIIELYLVPFFIEKKYHYLLKVNLIKIVLLFFCFFLCRYLSIDEYFFYLLLLLNIFLIVGLSQYNSIKWNFRRIKYTLSLVGLVALIDSFVVQIPKFYLNKIDRIELVADFTIFYYLVFPLGLIMEALSITILKDNDDTTDVKKANFYYYSLILSSILYFVLLFIIKYLGITNFDFKIVSICILFAIFNYSILHIANNRIINFSNSSSFKFLFPYLIYLIMTVFLCYFNFSGSVINYFFILISSTFVKGLALKYVN